ncbi:Glycoside hydrolase [Ceratobasidium theobromae]|uniref:AA9 family lytic polysaccharide monooxygenase n=1 Tax=Ceratobasidium theobromae TaxID=1582974 RepID=A0A5N5QCI9_9AGAM|nr:Glycoside hydrolase [Ceratobasidium theobromae]
MKVNPSKASFFVIVASTLEAAAHGGVIGYSINGVYYEGFKAYNTPTGQTTIQREWDSYDPITDVTNSKLSCNAAGSIMPNGGQLTATITAGAKVIAYWNAWPHTVGPVMVYMAKCTTTCSEMDTSQADWFKIQEGGLLSGTVENGKWAMGDLVANNNSWTTTLPASLAPGEYLLRHELLALHSPNQPQFYPEVCAPFFVIFNLAKQPPHYQCAQLKITTGGSAVGSPTVKFPGGYSASDPAININASSLTQIATQSVTKPLLL